MDKNRAELVSKYFLADPKPASYVSAIVYAVGGIALILIAGAIYIYGMSQSHGSYYNSSNQTYGYLGLCCGGSGLLGLFLGLTTFLGERGRFNSAYNKTHPRATDAQMDFWMAEDRRHLLEESFQKLELMEDNFNTAEEPLVIVGPTSHARMAVGQDGVLRFSNYSVVIIYLSTYHLASFSCSWDFVNAVTKTEETQEYHYQDVVSVATLTSNTDFTVTTIDGKVHPIANSQEFSLSVASGERIRVVVSFPQVEGIVKESRFMPSGTERAISRLRAMLREKKGGIPIH